MKPKFTFDLAGSKPPISAKGGTIQQADQATFPALAGNGLALFLVTLQPGAALVPHWHPDAAELDYCLEGKVELGLYGPEGELQRTELTAGQISIIPRGWFHYFQNVGTETLRMLAIFNDSDPDEIGISVGFQAIPPEVLGLTFGVPAERFKGLDLHVPAIAPK